MAITTRISKWDNRLGLRLRRSIAREARLNKGDRVQVSIDNGAIVVTPCQRRYTLEELVSRITTRNRHDESAWDLEYR